MANQTLPQVNPNSALLDNLRLLKNSKNSEDVIKNLAMKDTQISGIYLMLNGSNNYEQIFIEQAKSKGQSEEQAKQSLQEIRQIWNSL